MQFVSANQLMGILTARQAADILNSEVSRGNANPVITGTGPGASGSLRNVGRGFMAAISFRYTNRPAADADGKFDP